MLVEAHQQFGHGQHRVVAQPARHRARVCRLAAAHDAAMADVAANACDQPDRLLARDQHRALLDVQLHPAGEPARDRAAAGAALSGARSTPHGAM